VVNALSTCCDAWWAELVNKGAPSDLVLTSTNWVPTGHWSQVDQFWKKNFCNVLVIILNEF